MKKRILLGIAAISMVAMLSSCDKIPQTEIDAANVAINDAKTAGADIYVPEEFTMLQDSMKSINEIVETQKSKWFPKYDVVRTGLTNVTALAATTKTNTLARIEELKAEIQKSLEEVKALVIEDKDLITKAPKGKEGAAALDAIKNEISVIETSITEVETMFQAGQLLPANDKITAAKMKASSINAELTEVIAKYKSKKR